MNARLGHRRSPFSIALHLTMSLALLGVLAMRASAQVHTTGRSSLLIYGPQSAGDSKNQPSNLILRRSEPADSNRNIYYKNKLEFSWEGGGLPNNIPFVFDLFIGHQDKLSGLNYTLMPFLASIRWHMTNIGGRWILRGNWDLTFSGAFTLIPRGPETRY